MLPTRGKLHYYDIGGISYFIRHVYNTIDVGDIKQFSRKTIIFFFRICAVSSEMSPLCCPFVFSHFRLHFRRWSYLRVTAWCTAYIRWPSSQPQSVAYYYFFLWRERENWLLRAAAVEWHSRPAAEWHIQYWGRGKRARN